MQQNMNSDSYMMESPDIQRRMNTKAGVQLAPIAQQPQMAGIGQRQSLMSMKGLDENGSESHPILRVQNYKKPQLDKIQQPNKNNGFTMNMGEVEQQYMNNGKIQMTF